jgi:DNA-directed RNA polymerase subunit RPC12/RpoP
MHFLGTALAWNVPLSRLLISDFLPSSHLLLDPPQHNSWLTGSDCGVQHQDALKEGTTPLRPHGTARILNPAAADSRALYSRLAFAVSTASRPCGANYTDTTTTMTWECPECYDDFYDLSDCRDHMEYRSHRPQCPACSKEFWTAHALSQHQNATGHLGRRYKCQTCDQDFPSNESGLQHMVPIRLLVTRTSRHHHTHIRPVIAS